MSQSYVRLPVSNYAGTPYDADTALTSQDFDIRVLVRASTWTPTSRLYPTGHRGSSTGWYIDIETNGLLRFAWTSSAGSSFVNSNDTIGSVVTAGDWAWLRITRESGTFMWYVATPDDADANSWTNIRGTGYSTDLNAILENTTSGLGVRANNSAGGQDFSGEVDLDVARLLIYRGGLAGSGTLVTDFDPSLAEAGQPESFVTTTGETWTFTGTTYEVFHAGTAVTLSPDGFVSASGIEDQAAGTTDLHEAIDDSPDDSDADTTYLVNSGSATGTAWVTLSNTPVDFSEMLTLSVRVRARREA